MQSTRTAIEKNYEEWSTKNPALDAQISSDERFTDMARDVLGSRFSVDFFYSYGLPSLIVHAKPHGIPGVLRLREDGQMERRYDSVWLDRKDELAQGVGMALQYAMFIALNYGLDSTKVSDLNARFSKAGLIY